MQQRHLILSRLTVPEDPADKYRPGFPLAVLLLVLPVALLYAADIQALI